MDADPARPKGIPRRGQLLFAAGFLGFAVLMALAYPGQTSWVEKSRLAAQPGFWPGVAVGGMVLFSALHLLRLRPRRLRRPDWVEGRKWLTSLEFAGWFLAYVFAVPLIGYLPASLIFLPGLCWRMGYRSGLMLGLAALMAVVVVVGFKGFLQVRIPGGALYEFMPGTLRSFFITYL